MDISETINLKLLIIAGKDPMMKDSLLLID